jgi:hypothetical protein
MRGAERIKQIRQPEKESLGSALRQRRFLREAVLEDAKAVRRFLLSGPDGT